MRLRSLIPILAFALTIACLVSCKTDNNNPPAVNNTVQIKDNFFDPPSLTVAVGRSVVWRHVGTSHHTVTSGTPTNNPGAIFESGELANGGGFTFVFGQTGTYPYFCRIHGINMTGTIIVQ